MDAVCRWSRGRKVTIDYRAVDAYVESLTARALVRAKTWSSAVKVEESRCRRESTV